MKPLRTRQGFTLTELLIALGIAAVAGLAGLGYYRTQVRALSTHSATLDATDKVRAAMAFISRELREAGYDPSAAALAAAGFKGIRYAGPNGIWIEFDQNGGGAIDPNAADPAAESVIYSYDATNQQILRTVAGVSQSLVKNVPAGSFAFQYYDAAGNALAMSTAASLTVPNGYPSVPSEVAQALTAGGTQMVGDAGRDLIALARVSLQVQTVGTTPTTSLSLSARVSVPNRLLDRL
ncbi:MAG: prepilin-type N-terminal cleavage/methylation domain-containing protein [Deltaproteobacteria bacterium]|nr:prepilin-type N-terminal cleavage/methylation domain-containing protein [Deltaproteobacteria bacterium]